MSKEEQEALMSNSEKARRQKESGRRESIAAAIMAWRTRAVRVVLVVLAVVGLPAWGAVILNAWRAGEMSALIWLYLVVYVTIVLLAFLPGVQHQARVWGVLLLGYANGVASMARLGLTGSGRIYLLVVPVFTTVVVGTRAGLATASLSMAIYFFFTALEAAASTAGAAPASLWIEAGAALAAFLLFTVVLLARFSQFQLQILRDEREARTQLEAARAELEAYSQTLEEKVRERTARLAEAKQAAEAASQRYERELQFAGRVQASFMASELPAMPSWETAAALIPARLTSGDFYDLFPLPTDGRHDGEERPDHYGVLIADVVDKGVGAALFMALCWALLHTYARRYPGKPERVLAATNRRILRDTHAGQFVTVFYGVLDAQSGEMVYASAGHPPPFRFRKGELEALPLTGIPLGILEDEQWKRRKVQFRPGDLCLLYTDGVTEAQNAEGDFYDAERVAAVLRRTAGRSASEIRAALLSDIERFTGTMAQSDDITLLVLAHSAVAGEAPPAVETEAESWG